MNLSLIIFLISFSISASCGDLNDSLLRTRRLATSLDDGKYPSVHQILGGDIQTLLPRDFTDDDKRDLRRDRAE